MSQVCGGQPQDGGVEIACSIGQALLPPAIICDGMSLSITNGPT